MINRRFLLFAIALVLLPAATGCHDSAKIAPAMPAASPTPIPQAQKLAPPQVIEIKTFKVASPAAFSPDQLLGAGRVKFEVAGTAGQALLINVSTPVPQAGASSYSLSVQLQGNDSPEIPEAIPIRAGYCSGNYLYALPSTGTYQVLFDRAGVKHGIELTLLASDDPILNSGITPEQIDIDFGGLAKKTNLSVAPYSEIDGCGREVPSNMVVENDRFEFRVMQVAGYQELFKADRSMALLEAALRPGSMVASGQ